MTISHDGVQLPIKTCLPIDWKNTKFLAHYDITDEESLSGMKPIGNRWALGFDGVDDYVDTEVRVIDTVSFTVEMWIKLDELSKSEYQTVCQYDGGADRFIISINNDGTGLYKLRPFFGGTALWGSTSLEVNRWYHVVLSRDSSGNATIYLNGVNDGAGAFGTTSPANVNFTIGRLSDRSNGGEFSGSMSEVRVWNKPLNEQTIKTYMYKHLEGNEDGLIGYWKLDQGEGIVANDITSSNNDGVIHGATWTDGMRIATLRGSEGKFGGCIAVEEGTTNIAPYTDYSNRNYNQTYNASSWGGDGADIIYHSSGGYNNLPYKKMVKHTGGTGGSYFDDHKLFRIEDNKTYVISCYMKADRDVVVNGYALDINRESDNAYRTGGSISLTTNWKRHSWVYNSGTGHAGDYKSRQIIYIDDVLPTEIYWCGFQVEEKSFETSYTNGSRGDGNLVYPKHILNKDEGTINMWVSSIHDLKPMASGLGVGQGDRPLIMAQNRTDWNSVDGTFLWYLNDGDYSYLLWAGGSITGTDNLSWKAYEWHMLTSTWSKSKNEIKMYIDGEQDGGTIAYRNWTPDNFKLGNVNSNMMFDELRIDSVARTDSEVETWYASQSPFFPKGVHKKYLK